MIFYDCCLLLFVSWLGAFLLSPWVVKLLGNRLMDDVCDRSSHTLSTPSGGGVVFVLAVSLIWLLDVFFNFIPYDEILNILLPLSVLNALLGLIDDRFDLAFWKRLCVQSLLVIYPAIHMPLIFTFIPHSLQYILYIISWVWFINLFNFMDGTDGYATQETLFIMLGLFFFTPGLRLVAISLMGTCLGFLRVNYPKASLFMGDVGSYYLGYLLFGLILMTVTHHPYLLFPCLSVTLLFTFDATYTLIKRVVTRQPFWKAHRSHWYQRLYNMGCSHKAIFWIGVAINSVLLSVTLLSFYFNQTVIGFMLSLMILVIIAFFIRYREYAVKLEKESQVVLS